MGNRNAGANAQKSAAQHKRDGTWRKDRHAELNSPEPTLGRPEPLAELDKFGVVAWDWLMWAAADMGMLAKVDAAAAFAFAQLWSKTMQVDTQQDELRGSLKVLEGNLADVEKADTVALLVQMVTLQKLISKCTDQSRSGWTAIRQYLVEFGLTPASRGRIKLPKKAEKVDEFTAFQQKRGAA